jgi:TatA/E family protein of Tat protein translocase
MFSVPDIMVVSVLALLLFGPDRLPKVMRQAGRFMREVQSTSHSFVAEMERAADANEPPIPREPPVTYEHDDAQVEAEPEFEHEIEPEPEHQAEVEGETGVRHDTQTDEASTPRA